MYDIFVLRDRTTMSENKGYFSFEDQFSEVTCQLNCKFKSINCISVCPYKLLTLLFIEKIRSIQIFSGC